MARVMPIILKAAREHRAFLARSKARAHTRVVYR